MFTINVLQPIDIFYDIQNNTGTCTIQHKLSSFNDPLNYKKKMNKAL